MDEASPGGAASPAAPVSPTPPQGQGGQGKVSDPDNKSRWETSLRLARTLAWPVVILVLGPIAIRSTCTRPLFTTWDVSSPVSSTPLGSNPLAAKDTVGAQETLETSVNPDREKTSGSGCSCRSACPKDAAAPQPPVVNRTSGVSGPSERLVVTLGTILAVLWAASNAYRYQGFP